MSLRLPDKWIWDFWLARSGDDHHIFYLQAPRSLERPILRHHHASIGHAVSRDLRSWQVLEDALHPSPDGSWDDLATWTGSTIQHEGRWYMLYTGINRDEAGLIQRIGLAVSDDLVHWEKHPGNPLLEADPRWYDLLDESRWRDQSWRDPWVFRNADDGAFHCLMTARSPLGSADAAGVVAHARSADLLTWEVLPPLTAPGEFAQVEAPQLVRLNGRFDILVSCQAEDHSQERIERTRAAGRTGTFVFSSTSLLGPYAAAESPIADPGGPLGALYAGKLVESAEGWRFMAFRGNGDRDFLGELTDPLPVVIEPEGRLAVAFPTMPPGASVIVAREIRSLLEWSRSVNDRNAGLPLPELREVIREELDEELRRRGVRVEPVGSVEDHSVPVAGGVIRVRAFTPSGAGPHPAFVHFHGGGFVLGTIDSVVNDAKCAHICRAARCVVVTVEYRLAPEHRFPTAAEDCYAALCWVEQHGDELGVDTSRLAVGGESAGGNLAAAVALMARDRQGPRLALQLLEVPVTDLSEGCNQYESVKLFGEGYGLDRADMDAFNASYLGEKGDGASRYASPLLASDLTGVAPAHVLTAEYDLLRDSGEAYAHRLTAAGVKAKLHRFPRLTHGAPVLWQEWSPARNWMAEVIHALERALHPPGS